MPIPAPLLPFWQAFARSAGGIDERRFYEAFSFGDSAALADELGALVLAGRKRATTASQWSFEARGQRLPVAGDRSMVTDATGQPLAVIETVTVEVMAFSEVGGEFAAAEGEGDGSLVFWREAHIAYFERECAQAGRTFSEHMAVVCERFRLVYPAPQP
jgi:uncharacterized protein YhfF